MVCRLETAMRQRRAGLAAALYAMLVAPAAADIKRDWDEVANIKDAAARIGKLHKAKGVEAAFKFIDACYRTHSLAEAYAPAFEACIAQDYLQTKMLVQIYKRTPPEVLQKFGSPTAEALSETVGRRILGAFAKYNIGADDAALFKAKVDEHGTPVFVDIVFPGLRKELDAQSKGKSEPNRSQDKQ